MSTWSIPKHRKATIEYQLASCIHFNHVSFPALLSPRQMLHLALSHVTLCTDVFRFIRALRDHGTGDAYKTTDFYNEAESRARVAPAPGSARSKEVNPVKNETKKDKDDGDTGTAGNQAGTAEEPASEAQIQTDGGQYCQWCESRRVHSEQRRREICGDGR